MFVKTSEFNQSVVHNLPKVNTAQDIEKNHGDQIVLMMSNCLQRKTIPVY